ncbi:Gfo/Idh/MocA family oxidoreductase [Anaerobacillus sp. CMMVII]|uniref:Gfo/Idh/MocA family protein n=1 Tax=Anaerobacillus sp. CMMVII TaxID=2755588 RepID=UPI0021B805D2|nr:Gfo/Idh/MocA family oxidoreductase [Anaerobacillus sp. CMMVII]MCT8137122.1 Gfo/Idh/MocA family oxidoreductase [Anaerobacillus sp. CMMVII]
MNNKVRWGVLSSANIARQSFIPAVMRSTTGEIIAIASSNKAVKEIADEFQIQNVYNSYDELLECDDIDAVYIPLPNSLHLEWVEKAAQKGKHVLCEKPAALTEANLIKMIDVCNGHDVLFMEAFMYQFHPQHQRVKEIISSGEIGEIREIQATFSFELERSKPNIRLDKNLGGGSLYDVGCYCLHTFNLLLESMPIDVTVIGNIDQDFAVDLSAEGQLTYASGIQAKFKSSFEQPFKQEYTVFGTKGKVTVPRAYRPDLTAGEGLLVIEKEGQPTRTETIYGDQYLIQVDFFSKAIQNNEEVIDLTERTVQNSRVIDACFEAMKLEASVKIDTTKL